MEFLKNVPTIVFNCATMDIELAEKMFNRRIDLLLEKRKELENKIYCYIYIFYLIVLNYINSISISLSELLELTKMLNI
jgi:hypothetical protein